MFTVDVKQQYNQPTNIHTKWLVEARVGPEGGGGEGVGWGQTGDSIKGVFDDSVV